MVCSHFVLDKVPNFGYIVVYPRLTRGALARRRKNGAESGRRRPRKPVIAGGRSGLDPGPLKQTVCDEQSGSEHFTHKSEPAARHASLDLDGSQRKLRA